MTFLLAMLGMMGALLMTAAQASKQHPNLYRMTMTGLHLLALAGSTLLLSPLLRISGNDTLATVTVGGLLASGFFGIVLLLWSARVISQASTPTSFLAAGRIVLGSLAGLYLCFAVLDHFWFFRGPDVGWTSPQAIGAKDVPCNFALVRVEEESAEYRCPSSLAFFAGSATPFVPWPAYEPGQSVELKLAIKQLHETATKLPAE